MKKTLLMFSVILLLGYGLSSIGQVNLPIRPDSQPPGVVSGSQSTATAYLNTIAMNAAINNSSNIKPFQLSGKRWRFGDTVVSNRTARVYEGTGNHRPGSAEVFSSPNYGTPSAIVYLGTKPVFDGSTIAATAASGSSTITITGIATVATDVGITLTITGGVDGAADFITGTYTVTAVTPGASGAGTWTLDRACANGTGTATGMIGSAGDTLWRTEGTGDVYSGLYFAGKLMSSFGTGDEFGVGSTGRAKVLLQVSTTPPGGTEVGKIYIEKSTFVDGEVGVLCGKNLTKAWEMASAFDGEDDLHADHVTISHVNFSRVRTPVYIRTQQSVDNYFTATWAIHCEDMFYFERGGETTITQTVMSGKRRSLVRIGRNPGNNNGRITALGWGVDGEETEADTMDEDYQILRMDSDEVYGNNITFRDGTIDPASASDHTGHFFECRGANFILIENIRHLHAGSILIDGYDPAGTADDRGPIIIVRNCQVIGALSIAADLIATSPQRPYKIIFDNVYRQDTGGWNVYYPDAEIVVP